MYTITVDVVEDMVGWRVVWQARMGSGRRVISLTGGTWYADSTQEAREHIHALLQKSVQDHAATIAEALLRVVNDNAGLDLKR